MDTCSQLEDYVAGRLASADAQAFEAHAASCPTCGKAIARRQAVERAAKVVRRNQAWRETREGPAAAQSSFAGREAHPGSNDQMPAQTTRVGTSEDMKATVEIPTAPAPGGTFTRNPRHIAAGVMVVVAAIAALVLWPKHEASPPTESQPTDNAPVAPEVQREAQAPAAPPTEPTQPTQPLPAAAPATGTPVVSGTPATGPGSQAPQPESLPLDTDIETLAQVVATSRCGPAVSALRARVAKNASDARSWALLTQCYAKRKRWKNAIEAYDKVVEHGDPALAESLQPTADAARAALEAASNAPAAPAPTPQ